MKAMRHLLRFSILFLILLSFPCLCEAGSKKKRKNKSPPPPPQPYVSCNLRGQLGNHLFQIATTLSYAWDHNAIACFPDLQRLPDEREKLFFRLNAHQAPVRHWNFFEESTWNSPTQVPFQKDLMLLGYFQSWFHFDHHRNKLLDTFSPSNAVMAYLQEKYGELISNPKTVAIHVRTMNAQIHTLKFFHFLGLEYYRRAIDLFPPDSIFVVFSDRTNWCKVHFPELGKNFVFIEGNGPIEDLCLMSMMKNVIIANSTFSWWGAYLNRNPDKIVVAPTCWHHPDYDAFPPPQPNHFFPNDWITVPPDFSEPYPEDMTDYDARSKSLDN